MINNQMIKMMITLKIINRMIQVKLKQKSQNKIKLIEIKINSLKNQILNKDKKSNAKEEKKG